MIIKNRTYVFFIILTFVTLYACDKISEPFTEDIITDTTHTATKNILLEDYTGHTCPNCPEAAAIAHNMQNTYGNRLILMTVHAGYFAEPGSAPYNNDLRCSTGEELDAFFGISAAGNPNGMINRKLYNSTRIINPDDWMSAFAMQYEESAQSSVKISVQPAYNQSSRLLQANIESKFLSDLSGTYKLAVYILEDSIVSPQRNNNTALGTVPVINDYVHRNVLRGSMNGTFGDTIASGNITSGTTTAKNYSTTLSTAWNESRCYIMAYVYDISSYNILQAEIKKIK